MSIGDALLAAIHDSPDDDLPRLAYADWLEENGDPLRAEFIHVQIERARLPDGDPRDADLACREQQLLRAGRERWMRDVRVFNSGPFARGFVDSVDVGTINEYDATANLL